MSNWVRTDLPEEIFNVIKQDLLYKIGETNINNFI